MNVVIYARYSSHNQTEQSIEGQIAVCTEFAKKNNYTIVGEYIDRAISGTTDNRPQFRQMIIDSDMKTFEGVIVYQLDRFARNRADSAIYKKHLKENGVRVFSANENINDDASGVLIESLLEGLAEYYSIELSQKVKRGHKINAEKCVSNGGTIPLGFYIDENKKYQINENEALVVKNIFEMYSNGYTKADIIRYLNEKNIKTSKGNNFDKNSIDRILDNVKYKGVYKYGDIKITNAIPQIINDELFDKVQEIRKNNKQCKVRVRTDYLLTTKLFCGTCKEMMIGYSGTSKTKKLYNYYACKGKKAKSCTRKNVGKEFIENIVVEQARNILTDENIEKISNEIIKVIEKDKEKQQINILNDLLDKKMREKQNLIDSLKLCNIDSVRKSIFEEIAKLEPVIEDLNLQIAKEKIELLPITKDEIRFFLYEMKKGNVNDVKYRKLLINTFIDRVYLYDDNITIIYNIKDNKGTTVKLPAIEEIESSFLGAVGSPVLKTHSKIYNLIRKTVHVRIVFLFLIRKDIFG